MAKEWCAKAGAAAAAKARAAKPAAASFRIIGASSLRLRHAEASTALGVGLVAIVLLANILRDLPFRAQAVFAHDGERLGVGLRIGKGDPVLQGHWVLA